MQHDSAPVLLSGPEHSAFEPLPVEGFDHALAIGSDSSFECRSCLVPGTIGVQKALAVSDDFVDIARSLDHHPLVKYPLKALAKTDPIITFGDYIGKSWDHLAMSCAFLTSHGVYLCVSRVVFHPGNDLDKVFVSFLRGRIFDPGWEHQDGYNLTWPGAEPIVFPTIFEVGTPWKDGGLAYGPEDPRIIIQDAPDAEPVIVFNMLGPVPEWKRVMYTYRPFTKVTTLLTVRGEERPRKEKNWSPFFLDHGTEPSKTIYFIWKHAPLTIVKCSLEDGICDVTFEQTVGAEKVNEAIRSIATLRGGTQLVPIPRTKTASFLNADVQAFVAFPRYHVNPTPYPNCDRPSYRPEIAVLMTNSTHFYFSYISGPMDFGPDMVMTSDQLADSCGIGRIIIPNSIARWEFDVRAASAVAAKEPNDVMTLTLTVNDNEIRIVRMSGIYKLLQTLPSMAHFFGTTSDSATGLLSDVFDAPSESATAFQGADQAAWRIRSCLEDRAEEYTWEHLKLAGPEASSGEDTA